MSLRNRSTIVAAAYGMLAVCMTCPTLMGQRPAGKVSFQRDVRPILSDHCFACHGPDEQRRAGNLRLDQRDSALGPRDGRPAIVAGDWLGSELGHRVASTDADERMPPASTQRGLTAEQIELLKRWISEGAEWTEHWSFVAPVHTPPPASAHTGRTHGSIDGFIENRLQTEGWQLSAEAPRRTLIRRVTLDLLGIPPTLAEITDFVNDRSPDAYERLVDRLLASPRYGENMAVGWLDAARYADTSGYQNDGPRQMWRWRDWVIDAFNRNLAFDQFTIEQLAGDLLEQPTLEQRIATGFNRNHRGNAEGGIIPEEYQVEYVVDRVDTTATVWLGLTLGCARCHDHKYDPIQQREYYQLFAYFNNIPESGRAIKEGNSPPLIQAPRRHEIDQLEWLDAQITALSAEWERLQPSLESAQHEWEQTTLRSESLGSSMPRWQLREGLVSHLDFDAGFTDSVRQVNLDPSPADIRLRSTNAGAYLELDGSAPLKVGDTANFGYFDKFSVAAWVKPQALNGTIVSKMTPVEEGPGYYVHLRDGHVQVNLVKRWLDDAIRIESEAVLQSETWSHLLVTYDGSRVASGIRVFINGEEVATTIHLDRINQTFAVANEPVRLGSGQSPFRGAIDDFCIYGVDLSSEDAQMLAVRDSITDLLKLPPTQRSAGQHAKLTHYFLQQEAALNFRQVSEKLSKLRAERRAFYEGLPTVMVMQEMSQPRATHLLIRGQYDHPGERVYPDVPTVFPKLPHTGLSNRLEFAKWLVDPHQPLTARVIMNRLWQHHFGQGIVRTTEDFGAQGDLPSHPELLDWLATEFVRSGWDLKRMQRQLVTSATYRQSSHVTSDHHERDPENRLLSRGPRRRLSAETIRDQALMVAGMLSSEIGGPSVKPYQPAGLWQEIATDTDYQQSHGDALYRRSLYTYWKRTVAPPTMVTFDATSREACTVQRSRTNTPLQALALLNDVTFIESARVLAMQSLKSDRSSAPDARIAYLFETITGRQPNANELHVLGHRYDASLEQYRASPDAARELVTVGETPPPMDAVPETAALTVVTSLILNLDEVLNKE